MAATLARSLQRNFSFGQAILQQRQRYSGSNTRLRKGVTLMYKHSVLFLALIAGFVLSACDIGAVSQPPASINDPDAASTDSSADAGSGLTNGSDANVTITF